MRRQVLDVYSDANPYRDPVARALWVYGILVRGYVKYRQKLKDPINKRTGQSLKSTTIKTYESCLRRYKQEVRDLQEAIKRSLEHDKRPGSIQG